MPDRSNVGREVRFDAPTEPTRPPSPADQTNTRGEHAPAALSWDAAPRRSDAGRASQVFAARLPRNYAWFEGHFPGQPVLAAAVQLHELVLPCLREARPGIGPLRGLRALKCLERILPDQRLEVTLAWDEGGAEVGFEIRADGVRTSTGTLVFDGGDAV